MAESFPIFLILLLFLSRTDFYAQAERGLIFRGFKDSTSTIALTGVAEIEHNGLLKLTDDSSRLIGHAFYRNPIRFKNSTNGKALSFSTSFAFSIVPEYKEKGGHGFAFTISKSKDLPKPLPSQYLGLMNSNDIGNFSNHVFAVEFDTVQDFEFYDMSDNHVGIDINSLVSNASVNASCFKHGNDTKQELDLKSGKRILAWIDYDSSEMLLNVTLSLSSMKPSSPILSYPVDLSPFFMEYMYVGFSASTGLLASSHYVFGWSFATNGVAQSLDLSQLPSVPGPKRNQLPVVLGSSLSVAAFLVLAISIAVCVVKKRDVIESWELDVGPHRFSYNELKKATRGFRDGEILGSGGFGNVYKGTLPSSGTLVAVKQINHESKHGLRAFISEIASIGHLRHRNLVQLLGWCRRRGDLLLVYEFMPYGNLDKYIFDEPEVVLTWEQRLKIVKGVASGLLYLHEEWEQTVIHRDIKAANVLLDSELNGRLGDFGLAKLYDHESNPGTTKVVGTLGYLAPELTKTGKPTTSSDVFAFGALLLEVACGRRPVETKAMPEELILVDWVWDIWKRGTILEVMDPRLKGEYDEVEALLVLKLGLMCSSNAPKERPSMRQVVRYLEGETTMPPVLIPPDEYDVKNMDHVRVMDPRVEDYVDSYSSSLVFDGVSGDVDIEAGSRSPLSS